MLRLGPFDLVEKVGEGGMGQIWLGRHRRQEVDVAVKVIRPERVKGERNRVLFAREARAMATLHHRGIIGVYDYGVLDDSFPDNHEAGLAPRSPYLVMDYAAGGSLADAPPVADFLEIKGLLLQILEGLAHAHAYGLIHRDLKPGNILIVHDGESPRVCLADFGIAYVTGASSSGATEPGTGEVHTRGTPRYMAPEQIRGQWRSTGPWTDLYALGVLAYELTAGRPPFAYNVPRRVLLAHLSEEPPELAPRFPVPPGFPAWISRLLQKEHRARFLHAADATLELLQFARDWEPPGKTKAATVLAWPGSLTTLLADTKLLPTLTQTGVFHRATGGPDGADAAPGEGSPMAPPPRLPSPPPDWRVTAPPARIPLAGVGLGLFGLQRTALVGRDDERDAIWSALASLHAESSPRGILLRGPSGSGKTALAEWTGRRAAELGAATFLSLSLHPEDPQERTLRDLVDRTLHASNLSPEERAQAVARALGLPSPEVARLLSARDELKQLIRHLSQRRPLILLIDELQWGGDAGFGLLTELLELTRQPLLVLACINNEGLAPDVEVPGHPRLESLDVLPLNEREHRALIRSLLPLEPGVVDELAERTSGNPHFAIELLSDWIDRGLIVRKGDRFELPPQREGDLPDSILQIWRERIQRITADSDHPQDEVLRSMELAACLGRVIHRDDWLLANEIAGCPLGKPLIAKISRLRMIRGDGEVGTFSHEMIRETLLQSAREAGRLQEHHRVCLQVLEERHDPGELDTLERRSRHLYGAGRAAEAVEPLLYLSHEYNELYHRSAGQRCVERALLILDQLNAPADDPQRLRALLNLLRSLQFTDIDRSFHCLEHIETHACLPRDIEVLAQATLISVTLVQAREGLEAAFTRSDRALELFEEVGDKNGRASTLMIRGYLLRLRGDADSATPALDAEHGLPHAELARDLAVRLTDQA